MYNDSFSVFLLGFIYSAADSLADSHVPTHYHFSEEPQQSFWFQLSFTLQTHSLVHTSNFLNSIRMQISPFQALNISPRSRKKNIPAVNNSNLLSKEVDKTETIGNHIIAIKKVHD